MSGGKDKLSLKEEDVSKILMAKGHIGKANVNFQMQPYIYTKRTDGIPIIDIKKMWEKVLLAARVIVAVKVPADVVAVSNSEFCQRAVLKFCKYTGATPIAGRFTPGTLTNQITSAFREPRLLISSEPKFDHQSIREASYVSIPVIAFCNTDANLKHIDIAIPCNTDSITSIGLFWWLLAREILRMRGTITRDDLWKDENGVVIMVDTFFYRNPEEIQAQEKESASLGRIAPDEYESYAAETDLISGPQIGGSNFGISATQGVDEPAIGGNSQPYPATEQNYPSFPVNAKPSEVWREDEDW